MVSRVNVACHRPRASIACLQCRSGSVCVLWSQDPDLRQLKETFFIREAQSCHDPVEADFFNTGGTAVRPAIAASAGAAAARAERRLASMRCVWGRL